MENFDLLFKLGQIIFVDLVLAGDNAIVIGLVAAKFSPEHRRQVVLYGVGVAVLARAVFAVLTVELLALKGLMLAGGVLLLWICWKLWQDLRTPPEPPLPIPQLEGEESGQPDAADEQAADRQPMMTSIIQIVIADLSMSLDNVLAVAGIADGHTVLLVIGLAIAVAFMIFAATAIANILQKNRWIGYVGLAIIFYVALKMSYEGALQLL